MALDIQVDLSKFRADMAQTSRDLARAAETGGDRGAEIVFNGVQRQKGATYARPTSDGRPRTGAWMAGTRIEKLGRFVWIIRTIGRPVNPITNYPGGYEEKLSKLNTFRKNAAYEKAHGITVPQVLAVIQNAIENALRSVA